jgi:dihydropteroate synthase
MLIDKILTPLRCGNHLLDTSSPLVMSILNVTPDSFYSSSRVMDNPQKLLEKASEMVSHGASILDVGGMSTRPGAVEIPIVEEMDRVIPAVKLLAENFPGTIISIDTYRSEVAESAIAAGATMINDISGGEFDNRIIDVAAENPVTYVLMHMRGKPLEMQNFTEYQYVIADVLKYFVKKVRHLRKKGIKDVIVDPGFGFSKTMEDNYRLINGLNAFRLLGYPVLVGVSRKSTLSKTLSRPAEETLDATTALHMAALMNGASILRVHDVRPAMDAIAVFKKLQEAKIH